MKFLHIVHILLCIEVQLFYMSIFCCTPFYSCSLPSSEFFLARELAELGLGTDFLHFLFSPIQLAQVDFPTTFELVEMICMNDKFAASEIGGKVHSLNPSPSFWWPIAFLCLMYCNSFRFLSFPWYILTRNYCPISAIVSFDVFVSINTSSWSFSFASDDTILKHTIIPLPYNAELCHTRSRHKRGEQH